jgi:hypothetical protein
MTTYDPDEYPPRGVQPHEPAPAPVLLPSSSTTGSTGDTLRYDDREREHREAVRAALQIPYPPYRTKPSVWRIAFGVLLGQIMFALLTLLLAIALWGVLAATVSHKLDDAKSDATSSFPSCSNDGADLDCNGTADVDEQP